MGAGCVVMALGLPPALVLLVASVVLLFAPNGSVAVSAGGAAAQGPNKPATPDPRLKGAYRFEQGGWIYVHLEGPPEQIGFQHGYMLAPEIEDALEAIRLDSTHRTQRDWAFFHKAARDMLWPEVDPEYKEELKGIVEGVYVRGVNMDLDDLVALNAFEELPDYYVPWYNKQGGAGAASGQPGKLQRVCRHWQLHPRPPDRYRSQ